MLLGTSLFVLTALTSCSEKEDAAPENTTTETKGVQGEVGNPGTGTIYPGGMIPLLSAQGTWSRFPASYSEILGNGCVGIVYNKFSFLLTIPSNFNGLVVRIRENGTVTTTSILRTLNSNVNNGDHSIQLSTEGEHPGQARVSVYNTTNYNGYVESMFFIDTK